MNEMQKNDKAHFVWLGNWYNEFYQWVRDNSDKYDIYISEYKHNVPEDFEIVWEKKSKKDLRNKNNEQESTIEILMKYKNK